MSFSCRDLRPSNVRLPVEPFPGSIFAEGIGSVARITLLTSGFLTPFGTGGYPASVFVNADFTGSVLPFVWASTTGSAGTGVGWHARYRVISGSPTSGVTGIWLPLTQGGSLVWQLNVAASFQSVYGALEFSRSSEGPSEYSMFLAMQTSP